MLGWEGRRVDRFRFDGATWRWSLVLRLHRSQPTTEEKDWGQYLRRVDEPHRPAGGLRSHTCAPLGGFLHKPDVQKSISTLSSVPSQLFGLPSFSHPQEGEGEAEALGGGVHVCMNRQQTFSKRKWDVLRACEQFTDGWRRSLHVPWQGSVRKSFYRNSI